MLFFPTGVFLSFIFPPFAALFKKLLTSGSFFAQKRAFWGVLVIFSV